MPEHRVRPLSFLLRRGQADHRAVPDGRALHGHRKGEGLRLQMQPVRQLRRDLQDVPLRHGAARWPCASCARIWCEEGHTLPQVETVIEGLRRELNMLGAPRRAARRLGGGTEGEEPGHREGRVGLPRRVPLLLRRRSGRHRARPRSASCKAPEWMSASWARRKPAAAGAPATWATWPEFQTRSHSLLKAWQRAGVKTVITPCSDCYYAFKRLYPPERLRRSGGPHGGVPRRLIAKAS